MCVGKFVWTVYFLFSYYGYSLLCYPRNIRCWMLLKALWTHVLCWFSKDQLWTSCSVLKWHSSFSNSTCKDVTHWAIGLYSDHNKSYVVYLQWHFCSLRHPRLHMYSGIPLMQKLIFYKFWYFSSWANILKSESPPIISLLEHCGICRCHVSHSIKFFSSEESWPTVFWSYSWRWRR